MNEKLYVACNLAKWDCETLEVTIPRKERHKASRKRLEKFTPFLKICRELAGRLGTWKGHWSCLGVQGQFPGTKDIIIWQEIWILHCRLVAYTVTYYMCWMNYYYYIWVGSNSFCFLLPCFNYIQAGPLSGISWVFPAHLLTGILDRGFSFLSCPKTSKPAPCSKPASTGLEKKHYILLT